MKPESITKASKKRNLAAECQNQHGYFCPQCGSSETLSIEVKKWARLFSDGTDDSEGDTEWEHDSKCTCDDCDWVGLVSGLIVIEDGQDEG